MKYNTSLHHFINSSFLLLLVIACLVGCTFKAPEAEQFFYSENQIEELTKDGHLYTLHQLIDSFKTPQGNYYDEEFHRYRATSMIDDETYLFSIDTLPKGGEGIYIRGRVQTDDQGGNFYKNIIIQQVVDGQQQNLRIGIDAGSISGSYPRGQELLIRCNGLAIGCYANQLQLCCPDYNNNVYANNEKNKVGWTPGRIREAVFAAAVKRIGMPDESKLQCDTITIASFKNRLNLLENRLLEARLVCIKDVCFTGQCYDQSTLKNCTFMDPDSSEFANVFAPTTNNLNYMQARVIRDRNMDVTQVSVSEFAKEARYYLPGAGSAHDGEYCFYVDDSNKSMPTDVPYLYATLGTTTYYIPVTERQQAYGWHTDDVILIYPYTDGYVYAGNGTWLQKVGILHCTEYEGSVTGVLSFYKDKVNSSNPIAAKDWTISICDLSDIKMTNTVTNAPWVPIEYTNKNKQL